MTQKEKDEKRSKISKSAASGATAIIFLIIGFQAAVFLLKVIEKPAEQTVVEQPVEQVGQEKQSYEGHRRSSESHGPSSQYPRPNHSRKAKKPAQEPRKVETFKFNPNTVTLDSLVRLGLSEKQAASILNYREKGGKFRTREDFKKMYTVSDSLYQRLEPFIDIPKVELNAADSSALVTLKGIGPYYAKKIMEYRNALGGFYEKEQLLEIRGIDSSRFEGLTESVEVDVSKIVRFSLDTASEEKMSSHPYIGKVAARAIVRLRKFEIVSDSILVKESILEQKQVKRLENYVFFQKKDTTD